MSRTPYEQFSKPKTTSGRNVTDTLKKRTLTKNNRKTTERKGKRPTPPVRRRQ